MTLTLRTFIWLDQLVFLRAHHNRIAPLWDDECVVDYLLHVGVEEDSWPNAAGFKAHVSSRDGRVAKGVVKQLHGQPRLTGICNA